jgi:hypothetical protein
LFAVVQLKPQLHVLIEQIILTPLGHVVNQFLLSFWRDILFSTVLSEQHHISAGDLMLSYVHQNVVLLKKQTFPHHPHPQLLAFFCCPSFYAALFLIAFQKWPTYAGKY